ncbi:hypothetical protein CEXT_568151 [Caerostris extrusa]|uniref:Uncharacterized protein n=1 Tax=Caerostris extrusa TaxID=172846 RepID=A0AAV4VNR7_CAEEX|nr:hypothetical protein CEXT_568151 [Caerostris extrusa]
MDGAFRNGMHENSVEAEQRIKWSQRLPSMRTRTKEQAHPTRGKIFPEEKKVEYFPSQQTRKNISKGSHPLPTFSSLTETLNLGFGTKRRSQNGIWYDPNPISKILPFKMPVLNW